MKKLAIIVLVLTLVSCKETTKDTKANSSEKDTIANQSAMAVNQENMEDIYQFKVKTLTEDDFDFSTLKGKKILVVNTASKCGLTPQYEQLQQLYDTYKDKNFVIVGFPANNFGKQEPGTNTEIAEFCQQNYGVSFPMMSKISVKGDDMHPLYQFLTEKAKNGLEDSEVSWNFQKYLIDESGHVAKVIDPKTLPTDDVIVNWIKG